MALRGHARADVGAYIRTNGATGARNTAQILSGPYRVPNIHMQVTLVLTTKTPVGTYRGPGRFEADFFRERLFDMAARDLGIDPTEFRRCNLIAESEMPYPLARVVELDLSTKTDSGEAQFTIRPDKDVKDFAKNMRNEIERDGGRLPRMSHKSGLGTVFYIVLLLVITSKRTM